jgi:hypothetical protein
MKVDPLNHCVRFRQSLPWALVHDLVAHPLMAVTGYSGWAIKFHNFTSHKAWRRGDVKTNWTR